MATPLFRIHDPPATITAMPIEASSRHQLPQDPPRGGQGFFVGMPLPGRLVHTYPFLDLRPRDRAQRNHRARYRGRCADA
jgi:hypothetical protein